MKNTLIKLSSFFVFIVLAGLSPVVAQQTNTKPQPPKTNESQRAKQSKQFQETCLRLKLTPEQEKQMRLVMKQSRNEIKTLKEANKDKPKEEKQKLLREQIQKTDGQVIALLTPEQQITWKQIKTERKAKWMQENKAKQKGQNSAPEMEDIEEELL